MAGRAPASPRRSGRVPLPTSGPWGAKDLGPKTANLARAMTAYNPEKTWKEVE